MNNDCHAAYAEELLNIAHDLKALQTGNFVLSSGISSNYYFDGRLLSLHPVAVAKIARVFLDHTIKAGADVFGGPASGAIPITGAMCVLCSVGYERLRGFFVRKSPKGYGTRCTIEGHLPKGAKVAIVEDVVSTGAALISAVDAVEEAGGKVCLALSIMDRKMGGSEELARRGIPFYRMWEISPHGRIEVVNGYASGGEFS